MQNLQEQEVGSLNDKKLVLIAVLDLSHIMFTLMLQLSDQT